MMVGVIDRCPTGIPGFDQISRGGFVRNSDNLVVGGPGSGKTTFLLQFLWNGVTQFNENGLYISFEPDIVDVLNDAMSYGWDFTKLSNEGKIKFMKFSPETSVDELRSQLRKVIAHNNVRRICFDPISILAMDLGDRGKAREKVFELSSLMKRLRVTTLYADESIESEGIEHHLDGEWTKADILRFLSDSVTLLYDYSMTGVGDRAIRILKMRRTPHERRIVGMEIKEYGIDVEYDDKQPSYRESYPIVEPSSLVFGEDPLKLANVPLSNPSSINRPLSTSPIRVNEVKKPGIGAIPKLPEVKQPVKVEPTAVQKPAIIPAIVNSVSKPPAVKSSLGGVSYSPATIPPRPSVVESALPMKKELTVFRPKATIPNPMQRLPISPPKPVIRPAVKLPVENKGTKEKKKESDKVEWID